MPSQFFTKRDAGAASETRQMAEAEQHSVRQSGALGILVVLLGFAIIVALFYFTR